MRLRVILVLAALLLGAAKAEEPTPEPASILTQVLSSSQVYCKVEAWNGHPMRSLCYAEKVLLDVGFFDLSLTSRYDLAPHRAITPMIQTSFGGENWFGVLQFGHTIWGQGGAYLGITAGVVF